jgi:hypothetical protein
MIPKEHRFLLKDKVCCSPKLNNPRLLFRAGNVCEMKRRKNKSSNERIWKDRNPALHILCMEKVL